LAFQSFLFFVPTRRGGGDISVLAWSIAWSAAIWLLGGFATVAISSGVNVECVLNRTSCHLDLWSWWLRPALTDRQISPQDLFAGLALCAVGLVLGFAAAIVMRTESGRVREFNLFHRHLRIDLNPRVWNWFLQEPTRGSLYRVTLKSGRYMVGQVAEYSVDPDDDVQEIVMKVYSKGPAGGDALPVYESQGALILRADIEMIERLVDRATDFGE
jgi:Family of unknown function (DUF6338)